MALSERSKLLTFIGDVVTVDMVDVDVVNVGVGVFVHVEVVVQVIRCQPNHLVSPETT